MARWRTGTLRRRRIAFLCVLIPDLLFWLTTLIIVAAFGPNTVPRAPALSDSRVTVGVWINMSGAWPLPCARHGEDGIASFTAGAGMHG